MEKTFKQGMELIDQSSFTVKYSIYTDGTKVHFDISFDGFLPTDEYLINSLLEKVREETINYFLSHPYIGNA